jgi:transposase
VIGDDRSRGTSGRDDRLSVGAAAWIVRTGSPRRDPPEAFGPWGGTFRRSRWSAGGAWRRAFAAAAMSAGEDFEHLIVASTIVPVHRDAEGAGRGLETAPPASMPGRRGVRAAA